MSVADRQKPAPGELYLDHIAHFLPDADAAAALLEKLGFAVTPLSVQEVDGQPAGASNRCVMLERGYIEMVTPTHDTPTAQRIRASLARFTGVHLATFGTPDAEAEHARLAAHEFEPQPMVNLERKLDDGNTVRFKVVRTAPGAMPEGRVQYVQHLAPEAIWTERNLAHTNGVTALSAVYVCADDVPATAARWARFSALLPHAAPQWVELKASRGSVVICNEDVLAGAGGFPRVPPAPAIAGYSLRCRDPGAFAERCARLGMKVNRRAAHYSVALPPELGGVWVLCE